MRKEERHGVVVDVVEKTWEQRYTNFFQALLTGVVCVRPLIGILGQVPKACLDGLFLFMALSSLPGNQLYERACLLASEPALRKSPHDWFREVEFPVVAGVSPRVEGRSSEHVASLRSSPSSRACSSRSPS